jgi:hypothetical protein
MLKNVQNDTSQSGHHNAEVQEEITGDNII